VQEDLIQAQFLGTDELRRTEGVMTDPPPRAFIQSLGDSNVQLRYRGWVDQRTHDFWMVRSEATRRVKLALEAAGMDMPEPIYRVQLTEAAAHATPAPQDGANPPVQRQRGRSPLASAPAIDLRVNNELQPQIDQERQARDETNLLAADAPRE
jgi:hypothetical protein